MYAIHNFIQNNIISFFDNHVATEDMCMSQFSRQPSPYDLCTFLCNKWRKSHISNFMPCLRTCNRFDFPGVSDVKSTACCYCLIFPTIVVEYSC